MFVTMSHELGAGWEPPAAVPIFYTPAIFTAKKELKAHALDVLAKIGAPPGAAVLTYNYSLEEFDNDVVARYADRLSRSIEIIRIATNDTGYIFSSKAREVTVLQRFILVQVYTYGRYRATDPIEGATDRDTETAREAEYRPGFGIFDHVIEELKRRIVAEPEPEPEPAEISDAVD